MALHTKATVSFVDLVRPDSYWPYPYTIEQAFEIFRWMVRTGQPFERAENWGYAGPVELLSGSPSIRSMSCVKPIESLDDLRRRFHFALLSACVTRGMREWRDAERVNVNSHRIISFPYHTPFQGAEDWRCEADIIKALTNLLIGARGRKLAVSLNSVHPSVRMCKGVKICVGRGTQFRFIMEYGDSLKAFESHWFHELARSEGGEPFLMTLRRAIESLDMLCAEGA